jgi:hypothetical protein
MSEATETEAKCLVVKGEVKRVLKDLEHHTAGDFPDALSQQVEQLIRSAAKRAAANGRKQVRRCDL